MAVTQTAKPKQKSVKAKPVPKVKSSTERGQVLAQKLKEAGGITFLVRLPDKEVVDRLESVMDSMEAVDETRPTRNEAIINLISDRHKALKKK